MNAAANVGSYILFTVADTTYGLRSEDVRHMEMIEHITSVPNASEYLEGVVFSRGQIVPVLNLRSRFGLPRIPFDLHTRLMVVQPNGRLVGLIVDSAREFVRIEHSAIQPPSSAMSDESTHYLQGIASLNDRLVLVLNTAAVVEGSAPTDDAYRGADDERPASPGAREGAQMRSTN